MKLIGLTGNIASGKSTVARLLVEMGAAHLDADQLVHDLYRPGTEVARAIAGRFGDAVLAPDGSVDRKVLGAIVFDDPAELRALEQIVHPVTGARIADYVRAVASRSEPPPALVIEAVKLIESGRYRMMDEVWFVVARPEIQRQRLIEDRRLTEEEAEQRLSAQGSIRERLHFADVIIENSGSMQTLRRQVQDAWRRLLAGGATEESRA